MRVLSRTSKQIGTMSSFTYDDRRIHRAGNLVFAAATAMPLIISILLLSDIISGDEGLASNPDMSTTMAAVTLGAILIATATMVGMVVHQAAQFSHLELNGNHLTAKGIVRTRNIQTNQIRSVRQTRFLRSTLYRLDIDEQRPIRIPADKRSTTLVRILNDIEPNIENGKGVPPLTRSNRKKARDHSARA